MMGLLSARHSSKRFMSIFSFIPYNSSYELLNYYAGFTERNRGDTFK